MADNNAKVIDGAEGSSYPISPDRNRILLLGLLMGVAIPGITFLAILFMDTRVHSRKDFEGVVNIPYLGEIPLDKDKNKYANNKNTQSKNEADDSITAEAFRILRTNMSFMNHKDRPVKVITLTSLNEGAGKTYISRNLAMSYVLTKKRVLLLDMDIRRGTLSRFFKLAKTGLTNYIADTTLTVDDIIQKQGSFDMIAAGTIAPNPAELLMEDRLDMLREELRSR